MQRGNSCLVGKVPRWIAEIMVAGSIPTALTSEEQGAKTLCYEIAKRHEGYEKKAVPARPSKTVRVFEIDSDRERPLECLAITEETKPGEAKKHHCPGRGLWSSHQTSAGGVFGAKGRVRRNRQVRNKGDCEISEIPGAWARLGNHERMGCVRATRGEIQLSAADTPCRRTLHKISIGPREVSSRSRSKASGREGGNPIPGLPTDGSGRGGLQRKRYRVSARRQIEPERIACGKIHVRRQSDREIEAARRVAGDRHGPERGRAFHSGTGPGAHSVQIKVKAEIYCCRLARA
jgi:hypothetical protein